MFHGVGVAALPQGNGARGLCAESVQSRPPGVDGGLEVLDCVLADEDLAQTAFEPDVGKGVRATPTPHSRRFHSHHRRGRGATGPIHHQQQQLREGCHS